MTDFGYTMMCEQAGPRQLVADVVAAENAGFDFSVISDHYFPWLDSQGHSSFAWSVLGAAAQATERIPRHLEAVRPFVDAGFTHLALVQVGGRHQGAFIRWSEEELLPALRAM